MPGLQDLLSGITQGGTGLPGAIGGALVRGIGAEEGGLLGAAAPAVAGVVENPELMNMLGSLLGGGGKPLTGVTPPPTAPAPIPLGAPLQPRLEQGGRSLLQPGELQPQAPPQGPEDAADAIARIDRRIAMSGLADDARGEAVKRATRARAANEIENRGLMGDMDQTSLNRWVIDGTVTDRKMVNWVVMQDIRNQGILERKMVNELLALAKEGKDVMDRIEVPAGGLTPKIMKKYNDTYVLSDGTKDVLYGFKSTGLVGKIFNNFKKNILGMDPDDPLHLNDLIELQMQTGAVGAPVTGAPPPIAGGTPGEAYAQAFIEANK